MYVRHDSTEQHSPLRPDHPGNAFKDVVTGEPDVLVSKQTNSCFYGEPDLHAWLQERGIEQLVLCGITTNHCCETTARMAGNLGYDVRFVLDATHTFDRGDLTAEQLAHATATNLNGEFATVVTTADVLTGVKHHARWRPVRSRRGLDVAERHRPGVELEGPGGDLRGERGELGDDRRGAHRALPAAQDPQVGGAQRGGRDRGGRAGDRADLDPVERAAAVARGR